MFKIVLSDYFGDSNFKILNAKQKQKNHRLSIKIEDPRRKMTKIYRCKVVNVIVTVCWYKTIRGSSGQRLLILYIKTYNFYQNEKKRFYLIDLGRIFFVILDTKDFQKKPDPKILRHDVRVHR